MQAQPVWISINEKSLPFDCSTSPTRDVRSWTHRLSETRRVRRAILCSSTTRSLQELSNDDFNYVERQSIAATLQSGISLPEARYLHGHIVRNGLERDRFLINLLISTYGKSGAVGDALSVFKKLPQPNIFSWTAMIVAYTEHGHSGKALQLFQELQQQGLKPDKICFLSIMRACATPAVLEKAMAVHSSVIGSGFDSDIVMGNALVHMYGKCGALEEARLVFDEMHQRNVISWTAMVDIYSQHDCGKEAFELFQQMQSGCIKPNQVTFISVLNACTLDATLREGQLVHSYIVCDEFESDIVVQNALIYMYGKCGALDEAAMLFDHMLIRDSISWNSIIVAFAHQGNAKKALDLFWKMQQLRIMPDTVTFSSLLDACANPVALAEGKVIHQYIIDFGFLQDCVIGSGLINMYANCGALEEAKTTFDKMQHHNVVSWSRMIAAFSENGQPKQALQLFQTMCQQGVRPNKMSFMCILKICSNLAAIEESRVIHACLIDCGFESDVAMLNALVDMYGKWDAQDARLMFNKMHERNVMAWNALIATFSHHGHGKEALEIFQQMQQEEVQPNEITFVCALSACSHAGLVYEGMHLFVSMIKKHGIIPLLEHYTCMVDLFGRAGWLDEAENMISIMPVQCDDAVWKSLLGACRIHGDIQRGERVAKRIVNMDLENAANERWDGVESLRQVMVDGSVKKLPVCESVDVQDRLHEIFVAERSQPQEDAVYVLLESSVRQIREAGILWDTSSVGYNVKKTRGSAF